MPPLIHFCCKSLYYGEVYRVLPKTLNFSGTRILLTPELFWHQGFADTKTLLVSGAFLVPGFCCISLVSIPLVSALF